LWDQLSDEIFRFLSDITLSDLVERGRSEKPRVRPDLIGTERSRRAA
jgi:Rrf2 family iron-sulfur cluster assembly transcriptional regulator